LQRLAQRNPDAVESHIAIGEAALDAQLWGEARQHLERAVATAPPPGPSRQLCRLMARLEDSEDGNPAAARDWLDRALVAPHDPGYACLACGIETAAWQPLCPNCGEIDTLRWHRPAEDDFARLPPPKPHTGDAPLILAPTETAAEPSRGSTIVTPEIA
jgi:HemY protein